MLGYNQETNASRSGEASMKRLIRSALLLATLATPLAALAWGNEEYDACILQYQQEAKTDLASHLIKEACAKLYKEGDFLLSDELDYYRCLLEHVPGVENNRALESIRQACRSRSQD